MTARGSRASDVREMAAVICEAMRVTDRDGSVGCIGEDGRVLISGEFNMLRVASLVLKKIRKSSKK